MAALAKKAGAVATAAGLWVGKALACFLVDCSKLRMSTAIALGGVQGAFQYAALSAWGWLA